MFDLTQRLAVAALALSAAACTAASADNDTPLEAALASEIRAEDRARDVYRNPAETLAFFGVEPDMIIGEYSAGGGWYTRILAPLVAENGRYVMIERDNDLYIADEERRASAKASLAEFPGRVAEWTGLPAESIAAFEIDEAPEDAAGALDAVFIFRSMHGLWSREIADSAAADIYGLLKPGGVLGVVQHRAKADAPHAYVSGANGYLKQAQVVALFESQGFELVGDSEVNANSKDPANWEGGVWTLPPVLRYEEENREEYLAIGESDRMTLLFRKPAAAVPDRPAEGRGS
ncbi:MAG: hypothetical protein AAFX03_01215 [Pseudomonadota bacterium]